MSNVSPTPPASRPLCSISPLPSHLLPVASSLQLIIGFESGIVVLWDLKSKKADYRYTYDEVRHSPAHFLPHQTPTALFLHFCLLRFIALMSGLHKRPRVLDVALFGAIESTNMSLFFFSEDHDSSSSECVPHVRAPQDGCGDDGTVLVAL